MRDNGSFEVVVRGGNLAIQVYAPAFDPEAVDHLAARVGELDGRLDGGQDRLRVFTVPVRAGFPAVESLFDDFVARTPEAEWYFGNVYDALTALPH